MELSELIISHRFEMMSAFIFLFVLVMINYFIERLSVT